MSQHIGSVEPVKRKLERSPICDSKGGMWSHELIWMGKNQ